VIPAITNYNGKRNKSRVMLSDFGNLLRVFSDKARALNVSMKCNVG
jgi:hypothetical protein